MVTVIRVERMTTGLILISVAGDQVPISTRSLEEAADTLHEMARNAMGQVVIEVLRPGQHPASVSAPALAVRLLFGES